VNRFVKRRRRQFEKEILRGIIEERGKEVVLNFEDLSEKKSRAMRANTKDPHPRRALNETRAKRANKTLARSNLLVSRGFHLRALALTNPFFHARPPPFLYAHREIKSREKKMPTLRVTQTSPFDVHRRLSHVLEMDSQIRASRFARFRRVVGLSGVFNHGCFPNKILLGVRKVSFSFELY
jgi:hypothetical protein